jgi:hypothetical protein
MGTLYVKPDGTVLCFIPGDERDPVFELGLHRREIPFIVHQHADLTEELLTPSLLHRGPDAASAVAHIRTTSTRQRDGSLVRTHVLHHPDGRELLALDGDGDRTHA